MVAGGAEAGVCHIGVAGFAAARALSTNFNDEPERASRPWDEARDGLRDGRRRRRGRAGGVRTREEAGCHDLRRDHRLRHERRCPPRDRTVPGRLGRLPLHGARAPDRGAQRRRDRLHQRARHVDAARRRDRAGRGQAPLRRRCRAALDVVDQVVHRASAGRRRQRRADLLHSRHQPRRGPADAQSRTIPRRAAISISSPTRPRSARWSGRCRTPSGSAAPTPRSS